MKIRVKIFRYDPSKDATPRYEEHEVEVNSNTTVLDVLMTIHRRDPTLTFNYSCRRGVCGSCTVLVNGIPVQACITRILSIPSTDGTYIIEPLPGYRHLKDLAVDMSSLRRTRTILRPIIQRLEEYMPPERLDPKLAKELIELRHCISCGACNTVCPVLHEAPTQFIGPYGLRILASLSKDPRNRRDVVFQAYKDGLYLCLMCSACIAVCPYEIPIVDGVHTLRTHASERNYVPTKLVDVRESILDPELGNPLYRPREERGEWLKNIAVSENARTLLFVGCMASYADMESVIALAKLMNMVGIEFRALGINENCCGMPLYLAGFMKEFLEIARKNFELFVSLGIERIVTPCPSCYRMLKSIYPKYGFDLAKEGIEVIHAVHVLDTVMNSYSLKLRPLDLSATYHDPCDLGRHEGIFELPRKIIKSIPGLHFIEMRRYGKYAQCCGAGGDLRITNPELSLLIAKRRLEDVPQNVTMVIHTCPTCKIQFIEACQKFGVKLDNVSLQELILKTVEE